MPTILVVEGRTDAAFFRELFHRFYSDNLDNVFQNSEGKYRNSDVIRELLGTGVLEFTVSQDIEDRTPHEASRSIQQIVCSYLGIALPRTISTDQKITFSGTTVGVIPVGLHNDEVLGELGVTRHALEDYLIKPTLEDNGLRENVPELGKLLSEVLPAIRQREGPFDSSKDLFQLIKPMVQHGFSDTGVVQKLMREADEQILRSVLAPLLLDVERAFELPA